MIVNTDVDELPDPISVNTSAVPASCCRSLPFATVICVSNASLVSMHRRENSCEVPSCTEMIWCCPSLKTGNVQNTRYKFQAEVGAPYGPDCEYLEETRRKPGTPEARVAGLRSTLFGCLR